jgi:hypothetical protein
MNPYGNNYVHPHLSRITEAMDTTNHHPLEILIIIHTTMDTMIPTISPMARVQATTTMDREGMDTTIIQIRELRIAVPVWLELAAHAVYCRLVSDEVIFIQYSRSVHY